MVPRGHQRSWDLFLEFLVTLIKKEEEKKKFRSDPNSSLRTILLELKRKTPHGMQTVNPSGCPEEGNGGEEREMPCE